MLGKVRGIAKNMTDLVGNTPLVQLRKVNDTGAEVIAKLEFFNPSGSVKDRIAINMLQVAEDQGLIQEGSLIVESTSGNTGIALAWISAAKGYKLILTMPESMSKERILMLEALGAEVCLTPAHLGMEGAIEAAEEILKENTGAYMPQQFNNPSNPDMHRKTTGEEIWRDTDGDVDMFVSGVGTGGTITGVGELLKERNPSIKIIAVEPKGSPVISGGDPGPHKIQGIGAGFIPNNYNKDIADEIISVTNEEAKQMAIDLAKKEGIFAGISSGANVFAALKVAARSEYEGKRIVTIICDLGDRYLSTGLFEE